MRSSDKNKNKKYSKARKHYLLETISWEKKQFPGKFNNPMKLKLLYDKLSSMKLVIGLLLRKWPNRYYGKNVESIIVFPSTPNDS